MADRLTQKDWLARGLKTLAADGHTALKAERLAKALSVSKGSFYWHFKDVDDFCDQLLDHWRTITTDRVIREIEGAAAGSTRLSLLMLGAFRRSKHDKLDQAVRVWALHDRRVAQRLVSVDQIRIEFLCALLEAEGVGSRQAMRRARFIYAASLGDRLIAGKAAHDFEEDDIAELASLFFASDC
ncbi:MAG: TetR/AcrR family transcriptional regulator [Pseudomonadota bacterium]